MKNYLTTIITLILTSLTLFSQEVIGVDSLKFPWYRPSINKIQFYNSNALKDFCNSIKEIDKEQVTILHLGDSHIQSEIPTGQARQLLQKKYGEASRGLIFPYSTAKTYSSIYYTSHHEGEWISAKSMKLPPSLSLGILGMTARSEDSTASFTITLNSRIPSQFKRIKIYCDKTIDAFDIKLITDNNEIPVNVYSDSTESNFLLVDVPSISQKITLKLSKTAAYQKYFQFYGMDLVSVKNSGINYHSSGVGGARFKSVLALTHFSKQIQSINPNLVILDFGTNDFLYDDSIKSNLEQEIRAVVGKIRVATPLASIILCSTQDLYYKQKNIKSTEKFAKLISKLSKELECGFWDWYSISGGASSLKMWLNEGLSRQDLIHLTNSGYKVKGELLYDAIQSSIDLFETQAIPNQLVLDYSKFKMFNSTDFFASNPVVTSVDSSLTELDKSINISDYKQTDAELSILSKQSDNQNEGISSLIKILNKETIIQNSIYPTEMSTTLENMVDKVIEVEAKKDDEKQSNVVLSISSEIITQKDNNSALKTSTNNLITEKGLVEEIDTIIPLKTDSKLLVINEDEKEKIAEEINFKSKVEQQKVIPLPVAKTVVKKKAPVKPKNIVYKVKKGDCLGVIADRHNVTITQLKRWNNRLTENLQIDQLITIQK
jgi:lysophospholipase L1-like esterase/LysM repeat protein